MAKDNSDYDEFVRRQREQMLKLVTKGFYNELINYGVAKPDILTIASHLLDHVMQQEVNPQNDRGEYYNRLFTLDTVQDEWAQRRRLTVPPVRLEPLPPSLLPQVKAWLDVPVIRASFVTPYPVSVKDLTAYFQDPSRFYFAIHFEDEPVGIIGAENMDAASGRLEMRKLVGRGDLRSKGIGKRATFAFLYYAFQVLNFEKVYIHSTDINIRNLNLNSHFGFNLEGVFLHEIRQGDTRLDIVRMGLIKAHWLRIFTPRPPSADLAV